MLFILLQLGPWSFPLGSTSVQLICAESYPEGIPFGMLLYNGFPQGFHILSVFLCPNVSSEALGPKIKWTTPRRKPLSTVFFSFFFFKQECCSHFTCGSLSGHFSCIYKHIQVCLLLFILSVILLGEPWEYISCHTARNIRPFQLLSQGTQFLTAHFVFASHTICEKKNHVSLPQQYISAPSNWHIEADR